MTIDVFISHSAKDKSTADMVCALLEREGIRCWIAPRDILPGIDWGEAIVNALEGCQIMVLIFSANANTSLQIKREVERAVHKGKTIIPFRIEEVMPSKSLEYFISTSHWLDALSAPLERHILRLCETIQCLLGRRQTTEPEGVSPPATVPQHPAGINRVISGHRMTRRLIGLFATAALGLYRYLDVAGGQSHPRTPGLLSREAGSPPVDEVFLRTPRSATSWSQMIDEARRLRALGKISDALSIYSNYQDRVDYLRMDEAGHFHKRHIMMPHDLLGVSIMDF